MSHADCNEDIPHDEDDRKSRTLKERLDVLVDKTDDVKDVQRRNSDLITGPKKIQGLSTRVQMPFAADDESDLLNVSDFQATLGKN